MTETTDNVYVLLKEYADTLIANTQEELDTVADDFIEIIGKIESHGTDVARLIYELLEHRLKG